MKNKKNNYGDGYSKVSADEIIHDDNSYEQEEVYQEKKSKKVLFNVLLVVFIIVFVVSAAILANELIIKPYFNNQTISEIKDELEEAKEDTETEEEKQDDDYVSAINRLREDYKDLSGWMEIDGTNMSFPVVEAPSFDPEYYLYRNYRGEDTEYGSIFLDGTSDVTSYNQIIHGHSMQDGSMFFPLIDFGKLDVYKNSPVITYDTYEEAGEWKIISVFKTNVLESQGEIFEYYITGFSTDEEKQQFLYEIMNRSLIDTGVDVNEDDRLITLSTCSYEFENFRTVVVARKVRDGEESGVDTSKAFLRDDVVYPEIWYNNTDDEDPNFPETFAEAYEQGITDWWYKSE